MLSYQEFADRTDEAIVRQWVRDNKDNLAWVLAGVDFSELSPNFVENQETLKKQIVEELGGVTFANWCARIEDKQANEALGLSKCWFCKTMFVDAIASNAIGGHLCAGCMRWFENSKLPASLVDGDDEKYHFTTTTGCIKGQEKMRQSIFGTWQEYCDKEHRKLMDAEDKRDAERAKKRLKKIPVRYIPSDPDNEYDTRALWALEERERSHRDDRTY